MERLISYEDVKNELGIDLAEELGQQPREVEIWLKRQERQVINFIACCKLSGYLAVEWMLKDENKRRIIQEAVLEQVAFCRENKFVEPDMLMQKSGEELVPHIAPQAAWLLENSGILYGGK